MYVVAVGVACVAAVAAVGVLQRLWNRCQGFQMALASALVLVVPSAGFRWTQGWSRGMCLDTQLAATATAIRLADFVTTAPR